MVHEDEQQRLVRAPMFHCSESSAFFSGHILVCRCVMSSVILVPEFLLCLPLLQLSPCAYGTWGRSLRVPRDVVSCCGRRRCPRGLLLLLLLVVQLDGQRDGPPSQPHQEDVDLSVGLGLLLPPHRVIRKNSPVESGEETVRSFLQTLASVGPCLSCQETTSQTPDRRSNTQVT